MKTSELQPGWLVRVKEPPAAANVLFILSVANVNEFISVTYIVLKNGRVASWDFSNYTNWVKVSK